MISRNRRGNGKAHSRRKDGEEGAAGLSPSKAIEFATEELLSLRHCILPAPVLARFHYQLSHRGPNRARLAVSHSDERFALLGTGHGGGREVGDATLFALSPGDGDGMGTVRKIDFARSPAFFRHALGKNATTPARPWSLQNWIRCRRRSQM